MGGHCNVLHSLSSEDSPEQSDPPSPGGGESQSLDLVLLPPPQLLVQQLQALQGPQLPSA